MKRSALLLVGLLAACKSASPAPAQGPAAPPSAELEVKVAALEQRVDLLEKLLGGQAPGGEQSTLPGDSGARLARVEQRLDKVVGFLKQAVRPEVDTSLMYALPIDPSDPVIGPADAPVTVVEAFEFLCPYCHMLQPTIDRLRAEYPKNVRVVSKYLVIHGPPAVPAGLAGCAAGRQGKYEAYQKAVWPAIWASDDGPDRDQADADAIEARAKGIGLDLKKYKADIADGGPCEQWMATNADVLERFGVTGTPTVFINGRVMDSRDYDDLKTAVEAELQAVKTSGVAPGRYYQDVVMARGKSEAVLISPFD
ncbi:MAG TPA: thioredoxin domain-containing protein [Kofleriaceae bacterium]|nr:thioredoxin domain-containing protein [Kofleriaceae bacterium]